MTKMLHKKLVLWVVTVGVFGLISILPLQINGNILDFFRLDDDDTIYDYKTASRDQRLSWILERKCRASGCLEPIDIMCGMEIEPYTHVEAMNNCFYSVIKRAKPWTTLGTVTTYCGKRFAKFVGYYGDKKDCREAGGTWGKVSPKPHIDF